MADQDLSTNGVPAPDIQRLKRKALVLLLSAILLMAAMFCLPAGTIAYWEAWILIAILVLPAAGVFLYFIQKDPAVLMRRMKTREKEKEQKSLMKYSVLFYFFAFLIPGFDRRYGWSDVPWWLVAIADILVFLGYLLFVAVIRENRYASRVVEVEKGQQVVTTGPYAVVRHPMYVSNLLIYTFAPLALGSYWAMPITAGGILFILVRRILNEEIVLLRDLPGYHEYTQTTRYRLIPRIW